ncbi:MAG: 50S ribosomal protein L21 [Candidatus Marinimicrobia bacterium]|nr:50S ribosomal protein L21 [Candidatus Neomarinimicrobiota bacterium]
MYAIVDISGKQFRVEKGQELKVPYSGGDSGTNVLYDRVLLVGEEADTHIGQPVVAGAQVDATILSHGREKKIIVFKFKRRKGYQKKRGHRQDFTLLRINDIKLGQPAKTAKAPAKAKVEKAAPKQAAPPKKAPADNEKDG